MDSTESEKFSPAEARSAIESAVGACSVVTDEPQTQRRLVTQAVASFVCDWSSVRPPLYLVRDEDVDVGALQVLLLLLFNTASMFVQIWAPSSLIKAKGCVIQDLSASNAGFFYWVSQAAYHRSLIRELPESGKPEAPPPLTVLIISPELAAEAYAWGYVLEISEPASGAADIKSLPTVLRDWKTQVEGLAREIERGFVVDASLLEEVKA